MQSLSTADQPACAPLRVGKRRHSRHITRNLDKETGLSNLDSLTDSESDSDDSFESMEFYTNRPLCSPSLLLFHEERSTDLNSSHGNNETISEFPTDNERMRYKITNTDCDDGVRRANGLQAQDRNVRSHRKVSFALELYEIIEIPSHRCLDPKVKEDMYTSMRVIYTEAIRNRKEWDFELRSVQNVAEEFDFISDCNGNLWHPAHWNPVI